MTLHGPTASGPAPTPGALTAAHDLPGRPTRPATNLIPKAKLAPPLVPVAAERSVPAAPANPPPPLVVIVDDDAGICWAFEHYFHERGWEVQTVASGEQGLELLDDLRLLGRTVGLVLVDISLPGIDGVRAIELFRKVTRLQARIIAMSAYHGPEITRDLGAQGVDLFLEKPIDLAQFDGLLAAFPR